MFGLLDILQNVLRIVTFQPSKTHYGHKHHVAEWSDGVPTRHRYERRGGERFFG